MKLFFIILFCVVCLNDFSQSNADNILHIDSLPPEGILLDRGWKFQIGDNHEWSKPEFDDSKWKEIDPTKQVNSYKSDVVGAKCWIRITILLDSSIQSEPLVLRIQQNIASEIFLD